MAAGYWLEDGRGGVSVKSGGYGWSGAPGGRLQGVRARADGRMGVGRRGRTLGGQREGRKGIVAWVWGRASTVNRAVSKMGQK